jgi:CheY-like chemotaxis protein
LLTNSYLQDTGCGIPLDEQNKLFKLFTNITADRPNKDMSTGLGLVLSRSMARALGGDLFLVHSSPGTGSKFRLRMPFWYLTSQRQESLLYEKRRFEDIPIKTEGNEQGKKTKRRGKSRTPRKTNSKKSLQLLKTKSILIVDDNELIRRILKKVLVDCRLITEAQNGELAVQLIEESLQDPKKGFDLIFMDCLMPVMDGIEATRRIRKLGFSKPIFALTGNSSDVGAEQMAECGFNNILLKPIRPDDLLALVVSTQ